MTDSEMLDSRPGLWRELRLCLGLGALAAHRIGGETGDVLGAGQQVTELLVLLGLTAVVL